MHYIIYGAAHTDAFSTETEINLLSTYLTSTYFRSS